MIHPPLSHLKLEFGVNPLSGRDYFSEGFAHPLGIRSSRQTAELASEVLARRPFESALPRGGSTAEHKWKVAYAPPAVRDFGTNPLTGRDYFSEGVFRDKLKRMWKIYVGSGCVNDEMACIQYAVKGDARAWTMPPDYGPYRQLTKVYGAEYPYVDRPLYEVKERPFLFLTAPSADETDLGGFEPVADNKRPDFFRTAAMWERRLFRAHVIVSQTAYRSDPVSLSLSLGGAIPKRWRVQVGKLPSKVTGAGVSAMDYLPLARVYLVRKPGKPQEDRLHVHQMCYWSLQSRAAINQSLLELAAAIAETAALGTLGTLPIGAGGLAVGTGALAIEAAMTAIFVAQLEDLVASISSVEFWSV